MGNKGAAPPPPPPTPMPMPNPAARLSSNTMEWMRATAMALRMLAISSFICVMLITYNIDSAHNRLSQAESHVKSIAKISNFLVYRCMLGCAAIGIIFTILLINLSISQSVPNHPQHIKRSLARKYQSYDEIMLIVVALGGVASMGFTLELSHLQDEVLSKIVTTRDLSDMYFVTGTYLLGFLVSFVSSVLDRVAPPGRED